MNPANVDALARIIAEEVVANGYIDVNDLDAEHILNPDPDYPPDEEVVARFRKMAEFYASRGVLVPSALYPQECFDAIRAAADVEEIDISVAGFRATLERIAKGES